MSKVDKTECKEVLEEFLSYPLDNTYTLMEKFMTLHGAIGSFEENGGKKNYVFVPGSREDRVLLVAHADTVWDNCYLSSEIGRTAMIHRKANIYYSLDPKRGIGADDRAGCAILWLLRNSGHSLLILDGEEYAQIGARHLKNDNPELFELINNHRYAIQFDRRGRSNYKCYDIPVSEEFKAYIEEKTGYRNAGSLSRTDICVLCKRICGVNLSVGYYNEHSSREILDFQEWFHTLATVQKLLKEKQPVVV